MSIVSQDDTEITEDSEIGPRRKRGRPRKSVNENPSLEALDVQLETRKRGRPKGSKNKNPKKSCTTTGNLNSSINVSTNSQDNSTRNRDNYTTIQPELAPDLHTTSIQHLPVGQNNNKDDVPGCLPKYQPVRITTKIQWSPDREIHAFVIDEAYNEITTWRKNTFLVPYGQLGRCFIDQFTTHINDWNNASEKEHIAFKSSDRSVSSCSSETECKV